MRNGCVQATNPDHSTRPIVMASDRPARRQRPVSDRVRREGAAAWAFRSSASASATRRRRSWPGCVDRFYWAGLARLGRMIRCFKREGVRQVVMAGKIHKTAHAHAVAALPLLPGLAHDPLLVSRPRPRQPRRHAAARRHRRVRRRRHACSNPPWTFARSCSCDPES